MQIPPMGDGIGIAEACAEGVVQRNVGDLFAIHRIHQTQAVDVDCHAAGRLSDAQKVEGMERVGAKLDTGTDFAEFRRPLQDQGPEPLLRQSQCRRQPAYTPARDEDGVIVGHVAVSCPAPPGSLGRRRCKGRDRRCIY